MSSIVTVESTEPTISADNAKSPEAVVNEVKEAEHSDEPGASIPGIKYTYDCFNLDGRDFTETYNTPLNLKVDKEVEEQPTEEQSCIFEILTRVNVRLPRNLPENHDDVKYSLDFMKVDELKSPKMIVYSPLLLEAIREVVKYYPSQNLIGDNITIREPYSVLIHHLSDLTNLKSQLESSIAGGSVNDVSEKCRHIQVLLDFLHPRVQRTVVPTEKRLRKDPPTILFSDIWFLLKPGTISYFIRDGVWVGGIIASVEYSEQTSDKKEHWDVKVLFQDTDFKKKPSTGPAPVTIEIEGFDGEKLVTTLPVFPRHYHDAKDNGERRASLESRGALVAEILWASYKYVKYNGKLFNTSKKEYKGPLIAGICDVGDENIYGDTWTFDWVTDPGDETTKKDVGPAELVRPVNLNIENCSKEALSADHLFMMCPMMPGFALSTKTWELINVESILELDETGDIPDANIHEENLRIIKALSDRQINSKVPWSADFIKSKGEGVAVLLHGPPGVGKTYTVETIAMKTGRPLISLTIADLGTKEEAIEAQLTKWFSLAQKWRAVLLLDEADIFLERREHQDIARNGIVSAFLRKMEYFGGLLFLTTNRVGHIDEAFISRVHVIIGFEKLDPSMRKKIWESFLNKLHKEQRGKIRVTPQGVKFVLSDEMCTMEWNGREIRNAFQTAIALAEYDVRESEYSTEGDEILVEANHFKQVMDMSREFRTYMNSIRRDTEDERAKQYYGRNDRRRTGQFATHQGGQVSIGSMEPVTRDNGQRT